MDESLESYVSLFLKDNQYDNTGLEKLIAKDEKDIKQLKDCLNLAKTLESSVNPHILFDLAICYRTGWASGIEVDKRKAFKLMAAAANQSFPLAECILGEFYYMDEEAPQLSNLSKQEKAQTAFKWFMAAATSKEGHIALGYAYFYLGLCFRDNIGLPSKYANDKEPAGERYSMGRQMLEKSAVSWITPL